MKKKLLSCIAVFGILVSPQKTHTVNRATALVCVAGGITGSVYFIGKGFDFIHNTVTEYRIRRNDNRIKEETNIIHNQAQIVQQAHSRIISARSENEQLKNAQPNSAIRDALVATGAICFTGLLLASSGANFIPSWIPSIKLR